MAFLVYWNVNQYHTEKNELVQDLNDQMNLAYSKYNDSLFTTIFTIIQGSDNILSNSSRSVTINNKLEDGNGAITVTHSGISPRDTNISIMFSSNQIISSDSSETFSNLSASESLVQSIMNDSSAFKMSYSTDSFSRDEQFEIMLNSTKNSNAYVKKYFGENLIALNLPAIYDEELLTNDSQIIDGKIAIAYRDMHNKDPKLHATFSDYQGYLFKK